MQIDSPPAQTHSRIVLTGGIGDVLALESYFSPAARNAVQEIYLATREDKAAAIRELCELRIFPNLQRCVTSWNDFTTRWCFHTKRELYSAMGSRKQEIPAGLMAAEDWGILKKFKQIRQGQLTYHGTQLFQQPLPDVRKKFGLPADYIVVCPYSSDKRVPGRDFDRTDWGRVLYFLEACVDGVVVNAGNDEVPKHPAIIDLSNQTTMAEAIAILQGGVGYLGIDSMLSVLAPKQFRPERILIKSVNDHLYKNAAIYYAPADPTFVVRAFTQDTLVRYARTWTRRNARSKIPPEVTEPLSSEMSPEASAPSTQSLPALPSSSKMTISPTRVSG